MAKRSKKKNPNMLTSQQKLDIEFNNSLAKAKDGWQNKLNITLAVVVVVLFISFLVIPVLNMSFSSSLSDIMGDMVEEGEDQEFEMVVDMSFLDILTALAGDYKDSVDYIVKNNNSGMSSTLVDGVFRNFVTQQEIDQFDSAYKVALVLTALLLASMVLLVVFVSIFRSKKKDNPILAIVVALVFLLSLAQWILFVAVGVQAMDKGQIQPHLGSYLTLFAGITAFVVYLIFRSNISKLDKQMRPVDIPDEDYQKNNKE